MKQIKLGSIIEDFEDTFRSGWQLVTLKGEVSTQLSQILAVFQLSIHKIKINKVCGGC